MPLTIQRTATAYQLWVEADRTQLFEDLSAAGWLCTLTCAAGVWTVTVQNAADRKLVQAPTTDVIVSDLISVEAMTVAEFNTAHPDNIIEEPGS